jgi:hypothetical protein
MLRCLLLLLLSAPVAIAADLPGVVLKVKPQLCIIDRYESSCDSLFQIRWIGAAAGDYCLDDTPLAAPLQCWTGAREGERRERRSVEHDFTFRLTDAAREVTLATAKVEVMRIDNPDRRRQRRGRHVWDVL